MSTVTSSTSATTTTTTSTTAGTSAEEIQERFLTMLIAQLQNQDPLDPMDNEQITSQMAQLSMVSSLTTLNETLSSISGQIDMGQAIEASALVGKDVLVPGNKIAVGVDSDGTVTTTPFGIDLEAAAASVVVKITDADGNVVRTLDVGAQDEATVLTLSWDGLDDSGNAVTEGAYYAQVTATDADGATVASTALTHGTVGSVVYTSSGLKLDLGLVGQFSLLDIYQIT
ncbi:MAG: flagellar hook capping FlgD N-terminal domain-containing protein [Comamonas sp.]